MTSIELTEKWSEIGWTGIAAFVSLLQDEDRQMRERIWRYILIKGFGCRADKDVDPLDFFKVLWERRNESRGSNILPHLDAACGEAARVWYKRSVRH